MGRTWEVLKVPATLIGYGFFIVALQPFLIKVLSLKNLSNSVARNVISAVAYLLINAFLLYSWYLITKKLRNSAIREAQSYSGSSQSDRPS